MSPLLSASLLTYTLIENLGEYPYGFSRNAGVLFEVGA
jgi:hypothetical protein